jgi:hypothetical protein
MNQPSFFFSAGVESEIAFDRLENGPPPYDMAIARTLHL